ncbi:MAG: hydantoinase/oxoprolinase family protein [Desulfobulbaceae bacterium]|nr:hydantoinase/oxoprolinase family protein [Desulfobulbaceae bacterium]
MSEQKKKYGIGIDTGGTFTDVVLVDLENNEVLSSAKKPTTHHNLSIGIAAGLEAILTSTSTSPEDIDLIAVSTTLATNAIVEGKGAKVGLLVIGMIKSFSLPIALIRYLHGGHNHLGKEEDPLEMEALVDHIAAFKDHVQGYAVCGAMSIINPTHEKVVEKAINLMDPDKPVFCSYRISDRPGGKERAVTTVLNARLMPVMVDFFSGLRHGLGTLDLTEKVVIIRGDATPMDMNDAIKRAATTFASGPAATAFYGASCSSKDTALVVDVGGTTTDITMIRKGRPTIDKDGSVIGEWQTHVNAVEMFTSGIGGDSHIVLRKDKPLQIGPGRVIPLALSADTPPPRWLGPDLQAQCVSLPPGLNPELIEADPILQFIADNGPSTPAEIKKQLHLGEIGLLKQIENYIRTQTVIGAGFTPTDALHVLGRLDIGNPEPARMGAEMLAKQMGTGVEEFCLLALKATEEKIVDAILDYVLKKEAGKGLEGVFPDYRNNPVVGMSFFLKVPIIGIGAAALHLLPGVAEKLRTEIIFPKHYEVGNALGALLIAAEQKMDEEAVSE